MASSSPLWQPRTVAVAGAALGTRVVQFLRQHSYPGRIYPVNPRATEVDGLPCYPSLAAVPEPVDLALIAVGADRVPATLQECSAQYAVIFASGFAETGALSLESDIAAIAKERGIRLIGPNCIGLVSPTDKLVAGFSPLFARVTFEPGNIGLVAQSGALGYGIVSLAIERGLAFSKIINTGNEADLDTSALIADLQEDDDTNVILVYCEGVKRPLEWRKLRSAGKPVIILKGGRSETGSRAAASHTAALAGDDAVWDTAFRQWGFHRVGDVDEMLDLAAALAQPRRAAGGRVGVLTTSGGAGILAADALISHGLTVPALSADTRADLQQIIPAFGSAANPVDVTAQVISDSALFRRALKAMAADPALDLLVVCFCVLQGAEAERVADDLLAVHAETAKPILVSRTGAEFLAPGVAARLARAGIPVFLMPERAARGAAALVERKPAVRPPGVKKGPGHVFTEPETKAFLARVGLPITRERLVTTSAEAVAAAEAIGFPVVLKIVSAAIPHKSEAGGVRLGLADPAAVRSAFQELSRIAPCCLVQEQVTDAVAEMLVGVSPTPIGPMLTVGLGGIFVEVLGDVARRLAPITVGEATAMLRELKGFPLLTGVRGRPAGDMEGLAALIARLSEWAMTRPGEWELDLNPVLVTPTGCKIADALLIERGTAHA